MRTKLGLALAMMLALVPGLYAQTSTGNIYGSVADASGSVLPGATVTLTGDVIAPRTSTTGSNGEFRFVNLDPGAYKLAVGLSGFATVTRDVRVNIGSSLTVPFSMKVAGVEETVVVTAETPIVDVKKTGTGTTLSREELSQIPNSRDPWAVLRQVPGVQLDRLNQAGTQSGQQSGYVGKGSSQMSSMWVLDGVTITDPAAAGASPSYFDFDSFDEVSVTTGGADIKVGTGGVGINLVTKRGTNELHGGVRGFYTSHKLESSNIPSALEGDPRLFLNGGDGTKADHADQISDYGADLGGPLVKDKLWFWGAYGKQDIRIRKFNQNPDKTLLKDYNAKVNWQATGSDMFSVFYFQGVKQKFGRPAAVAGTSAEDASHSRNQAGAFNGKLHGLIKGELNHVFNPNFVANLKYSHYDQGFGLVPAGGTDGQEYVDLIDAVSHGASTSFLSVRPSSTYNGDFNYFMGNHELKFGFGYRKATVVSSSVPSGSQVRGTLSPTFGNFATIRREAVLGYSGHYASGYIGDTYTKNRLTINAGVRLDRQKAVNSATAARANALFPELLPALQFDGSPDSNISLSNVSPRIGLTYALDDSRKTILRASWSVFADQLAFADVASFVNPVGRVGVLFYPWNDANNDQVVQREEVDLSGDGNYGGRAANITPSTVNRIDPDLKARKDNEFIVGFDRELIPNLAISANYTFRRTNNVPYAPFIGVNGTDWVPCEGASGNGFSAPCQDIGPENQAALGANGGGLNLTNRPDYTRHYSGFEFTGVKRLANKWMARASFSYNDWTEHFSGNGGIQNPNATLYDSYGYNGGGEIVTDAKQNGGQIAVFSTGSGTLYWVSGKWQASANALYQLPKGFDVAANLYARDGYVRPINFTLNNTFADTVLAAPIGDNRLPNIWNLDLRLAKNFNLSGRFKAAITADAFNVLNTNTTLRQTDSADSSAFNRIEEIPNPRLIRFGLRLSF